MRVSYSPYCLEGEFSEGEPLVALSDDAPLPLGRYTDLVARHGRGRPEERFSLAPSAEEG